MADYKLKILHGKKIIEEKINQQKEDVNDNKLYYRSELAPNIPLKIELDNLIVIEYIKETPTKLIKQNIIGCWNSECNTVIYNSYHKSFNQTLIRDMIKQTESDLTILLGDNLYDRPKEIVLNKGNKDIEDKNFIETKKEKNNYKSIIENGFECFSNAVNQNHLFFLILGNHDININVMSYEINKTYIGTTISDDMYLNPGSKWIMPEEFYVIKIEDFHYLMLNSNLFNSINPKREYQEKLIDKYINTYCIKSDKKKKIIICVHEPFYALGHKPKNHIISNREVSFYKNIIIKYKDYIHTIFTADEHNSQILHDEKNNIYHIVSSGAPYTGGDLIFYPLPKLDEEFKIISSYNSNMLLVNYQRSNNIFYDFIESKISKIINTTESIELSDKINKIKIIENKAEKVIKANKADKADKAKKADKDNKSLLDQNIISTIPTMNDLKNLIDEFNDKYKKLIKYHDINPKLKLDIETKVAVDIEHLLNLYDRIIEISKNTYDR
jgi:hypothetical protein